jgi:hypothetical protein
MFGRCCIVGRRFVLSLAGGGQRGGAGGVVTMLRSAVVCKLGIGLERFGMEPHRSSEQLFRVSSFSQFQPFAIMFG